MQSLSAARYALGIRIDRINRPAGGHEQAVPFAPAETQIGATLGQRDVPDHRAIGGENRDAVEFRRHSPPAPQISVDVATKAVWGAVTRIDENAAIGQPSALIDDVEDAYQPRPSARFDDVKLLLVGREAQSVRPIDVTGHDCCRAGPGIDSVDVCRQLGCRLVAFVIAEDAERRIGEPD